MKSWILHLGVFVLVLALGGVLVAVSGIVPIKASSGHWRITEWLLRFGMHRSFATHSLGVTVPPLDAPHLILKGATHYDFGCRSCHGSPGLPQPRIAQSMTPKAPYLPPLIESWKPAQLFSLVKHGVKFTGMPAWAAQQRDDEVWAVVAFLQTLPRLGPAEYERLVHGESAPTAPIQALEPATASTPAPAAAAQTCFRCHGHDGLGRGSPAFPVLAGQRRDYLENAMLAYAKGERHSGIMGPIAAGLSRQAMAEIADHYARLPPRSSGASEPPGPARTPADAHQLELGRILATEGVPAERIPACVECHGPAGRRTKSAYPSLAGQPAEYLRLQLELFQRGQRGGSEHAHLMDEVAPRLSPEQIRAVSLYFASLPADAGDSQPSAAGRRP